MAELSRMPACTAASAVPESARLDAGLVTQAPCTRTGLRMNPDPASGRAMGKIVHALPPWGRLRMTWAMMAALRSVPMCQRPGSLQLRAAVALQSAKVGRPQLTAGSQEGAKQ